MNVHIKGVYDNTLVDSNIFEDVKLLQTSLSSLSDDLKAYQIHMQIWQHFQLYQMIMMIIKLIMIKHLKC